MLKAELHAHTADDPHDFIPYSTTELIDRGAELGYGVIAITLHDRYLDPGPWVDYARSRGIVLIGGIERAIRGRHVLLLNFGAAAERVNSFEALAELKRSNPRGLVIAPHPFYPGPSCLRSMLDRDPDLFDAVELNAFYTASITRYNDAAVAWAARRAKPIVANADVHRLHQLDRTYTLIAADATPDAVCAAIRAGQVEIRTSPLSVREAITHATTLAFSDVRRMLSPSRRQRRPHPAVLELNDESN
jgi:predicted metal-dependent phosphoesterase TrpH